jgi:hypothetical protein
MSRLALISSGILLLGCSAAYAQEPVITPDQLQVRSPQRAQAGLARPALGSGPSAPSPKLPFWTYSLTSPREGNTYQGSIVGGNPFLRGARTATVPVVIVPLRVVFTGTLRTFDSTSPDVGCLGAGNTAVSLMQASPMFQNANFNINGVNVGNTNFADAFQRASFWPSVSSVAPAYHLGFNVSVVSPQQISVVNGSSDGATFNIGGNCSTNAIGGDNPPRLGVLDINFLDPQLQTIITNLGLNASQFPLFVLYGVVISDGPAILNNCCILGYHNGSGNALNPGQTYGIAEYDQGYLFGGTNDVSVLSHEMLEWINDPSVNNLVPDWGNIGQVSGCQNNLETGDPLSGTLMPPVLMPNGVTYHLQENAFFSWFLGTPYAGAGGKYSSNGTFGGVAKACPPGGTN